MTRPINPFMIPGLRKPTWPLCPCPQHPEHLDRYVDIARSEASFNQFTMDMATPGELLERSGIVLALGDSGCGKTALLNKCSDWLVTKIEAHGLRGLVVDLRKVINSEKQLTVDERMSQVSEGLLARLRADGQLRDNAHESLADLKPHQFYGDLELHLEETVLILPLPPVELLDEVKRYAGTTGRRIVFLMESAELSTSRHPELLDIDGASWPPVVLPVERLTSEDIRRFIETRLTESKDLGEYPELAEDALAELSRMETSVGQLQRLLCDLYGHLMVTSSDYAGTPVTYGVITDFHFRKVFGAGRVPR